MNIENSKTSEPHSFRLDLTDKLNLQDPKLNLKDPFAPAWNDTLDFPDGFYSISNIQDYFEFIIKKHETLTENPPVQIYVNRIIKQNCFQNIELLTSETMKLLGSTKKMLIKI